MKTIKMAFYRHAHTNKTLRITQSFPHFNTMTLSVCSLVSVVDRKSGLSWGSRPNPDPVAITALIRLPALPALLWTPGSHQHQEAWPTFSSYVGQGQGFTFGPHRKSELRENISGQLLLNRSHFVNDLGSLRKKNKNRASEIRTRRQLSERRTNLNLRVFSMMLNFWTCLGTQRGCGRGSAVALVEGPHVWMNMHALCLGSIGRQRITTANNKHVESRLLL